MRFRAWLVNVMLLLGLAKSVRGGEMTTICMDDEPVRGEAEPKTEGRSLPRSCRVPDRRYVLAAVRWDDPIRADCKAFRRAIWQYGQHLVCLPGDEPICGDTIAELEQIVQDNADYLAGVDSEYVFIIVDLSPLWWPRSREGCYTCMN